MSEASARRTRARAADAVPYAALGGLVYRTVAVSFVLFVVCAWMPRLTTIGDTDVGAGAGLLAVMGALMLFAPKRARLDHRAQGYRIAILIGAGFLLLWGYLGVFRLDEPFRAGRLILSVGQGIVLLFVISEILSTRVLRCSLAAAGAMLVVSSLLSLYNHLGGQPASLTILVEGYDRSSGLFKNPNQFGMVLALSMPFAVALAFRHGARTVAGVLVGSVLVGLLLAASKTNLAIGVGLLLLTMSYMLVVGGRTRTLLVVVPLVCLAVPVGGLPLLEAVNPRAAAILTDLVVGTGVSENGTVAQRMEMWVHSIEEARRSPLFGQGTGQKIDTTAQIHSHSHNVFVDLLRTTGVPGMFAALLFLSAGCWLAARTLLRVARLPTALLRRLPGYPILVGASFATFSYVASNQMSDSFGPSTSVFFWLCVGLLLRRHDLLFADPPTAEPGRAVGTP